MFLTFKLALVTTIVLFVFGMPLAYYLAYSKNKFKVIFETLVSMPLVLPPSVLGFYLLLAYSPNHFPGNLFKHYFNLQLAFSFTGIAIGSIIYSLPFMVSSLQSGFQNLPVSLKEASYSLGKSKWVTLFKVLLPNIKPSIITGTVLTFAHTIGEFGVVLIIGGSIPGKTKVASLAIYDEVQSLNFFKANHYALILFLITFLILLSVYIFNRNKVVWKNL
jgi:molybdate transport system permease protein